MAETAIVTGALGGAGSWTVGGLRSFERAVRSGVAPGPGQPSRPLTKTATHSPSSRR